MHNLKDRIKRLYKVLGLTTAMSVMPMANVSSGKTVVGKDKNLYNKELSADNLKNNELNSLGIAQENLQEVADYMSSMTMGELREQGFLKYNTFEDYKFTQDDFKSMQCGKMSTNVLRSLFKKYRNQVPKGKCLAAVREAVCGVTGENILAEPVKGRYWACNWSKGIEKYGDASPLIYLGVAKVDANGKDTGEGNINKDDLLYLTGATVISGGKQVAGHACFNRPVYDKKGEYLRTDARCDGNESLQSILSNKVGGKGRRYGDTVQAFCMEDDKPSPKMAMYLAQIATREAYEQNLHLVVNDGKLEQKSLKWQENVFPKFLDYYAQVTNHNSK